MRKEVAWVHVGPPKTGTTSVQSCLDQSRSVLEDAGLLYPFCRPGGPVKPTQDRGEPTGAKHDYLLLLALEDASMTAVYRRLVRSNIEVGQAKAACARSFQNELNASLATQLVLSSEAIGNMALHRDDGLSDLVRLLRSVADHIVFVIYVRHPIFHARSHQQHLVRSGRQSLAEADVAYVYPYLKMIDRLCQVVGRNNVRVRPYKRDFTPDFDIVADFAEVIGIDGASLGRQRVDGNHGMTMASALLADRLFHTHLESDAIREQRLFSGPGQTFPHDIGSSPFRLSVETEQQVADVSRCDAMILADQYDIEFPELIEEEGDVWSQSVLDDLAVYLPDSRSVSFS